MKSSMLPKYYYRRAWLRAFWIALHALMAVIVAVALYASGVGAPVTLTLGSVWVLSVAAGPINTRK